jgi:hypothetical protein
MKVEVTISDADLRKAIKDALSNGKSKGVPKILGQNVLEAVGKRVERIVEEHLTRDGFDDMVRSRIDELLEKAMTNLVDSYATYRLKSMVAIDGDAKIQVSGILDHRRDDNS